MKIGDKWGDWTVESLLGEGTFGKVYKIVRNEFGHTYESALKVIRVPQSEAELASIRNEGMEDDSVTTYFRSMVDEIVGEFTLMSELRGHSNIVSYEDHSVTPIKDSFGWEICIRMELLTPLYKYLKTHTMTIRDIITLGIDICKALEVCQKFNLIHRDIKPENIFVSNMDTYKLGDFGIARQMEKTTSGMSKKGTYSYMAPEVYKGQPYNSTVDIYSLGIVLYRFLNNNRTPFLPPYPQSIKYSDREMANVRRMSGDEIPAPSNAQGRLAEIVLKACAYDPKDRYERPEEMRRALESILYSEYEAGIIYPSGDLLHTLEGSVGTGNFATGNFAVDEDDEDKTLPIAMLNQKAGESGSAKDAQSAENTLPEEEYDPEATLPDPSRKSNLTNMDDDDYEEETMAGPELMAKLTSADAAASQTEHAEETDQSVADKATADGNAEEKSPDKSNGKKKAENKRVKEKAPKDQGDRKKTPLIVAVIVLGILAVAGGIYGYKYTHHLVPDVTTLDAEGAQAMIEYAGLTYDEVREFSDEVERGNVISQSAEAGSYMKKGAPVEVVISRGQPIPAPDLKGISIKDAEKAAKKLKLSVEVEKEEFSDTLGKDLIISQDVEPAGDCEYGQVIKVVKSKGITQVEVPDVIGKGADDASTALEKVGFEVAINEVYSSSESGTIVEQSVAGGQTADKGSTITISKSIGPQPVRKSGGSSKKKSGKKKKSGSSSWGDGNW